MTIKDIAKLCGVSVSTVSRVLNNRPDVSEEVRGKVLSAIEASNYIPNNCARDLVKTKSDTIGLVVQTQCHYFGNGLYRKSVLCISGLKLIAVYCVKADPQFILICLGKLLLKGIQIAVDFFVGSYQAMFFSIPHDRLMEYIGVYRIFQSVFLGSTGQLA